MRCLKVSGTVTERDQRPPRGLRSRGSNLPPISPKKKPAACRNRPPGTNSTRQDAQPKAERDTADSRQDLAHSARMAKAASNTSLLRLKCCNCVMRGIEQGPYQRSGAQARHDALRRPLRRFRTRGGAHGDESSPSASTWNSSGPSTSPNERAARDGGRGCRSMAEAVWPGPRGLSDAQADVPRCRASWRRVVFKIFPVALRGRAAITSMRRGTL